MTMSELRFPPRGRKLYGRGLIMSLAGIGTLAVGLIGLVIIPQNWSSVIPLLGTIFVTALGAVLTVFVWFTFIYGTIVAWRRWRQLRPPLVVIDADGVHYLAARSALVPWPDIERVCLNRTILPQAVVSQVYLRLKPGAALLR